MSCKNTITTCIKCYRKINSSFNLCRYGTKSPLFISLQWGTYSINVTKDYTYANINLPLTCNLNEPLFIVPSIMCNHKNNTKDFNIQCSGYSTNTIYFVIRCLSTTLDNFDFKWCIISK